MADDRPGEDATVDEIAEWMEEDFWESVTEGIGAGSDENAEEAKSSDSEER